MKFYDLWIWRTTLLSCTNEQHITYSRRRRHIYQHNEDDFPFQIWFLPIFQTAKTQTCNKEKMLVILCHCIDIIANQYTIDKQLFTPLLENSHASLSAKYKSNFSSSVPFKSISIHYQKINLINVFSIPLWFGWYLCFNEWYENWCILNIMFICRVVSPLFQGSSFEQRNTYNTSLFCALP